MLFSIKDHTDERSGALNANGERALIYLLRASGKHTLAFWKETRIRGSSASLLSDENPSHVLLKLFDEVRNAVIEDIETKRSADLPARARQP